METRKSHREIEPDHDGMKEVGEIGSLARVAASGEPPEGIAREEILEAAEGNPDDERAAKRETSGGDPEPNRA